MVMLTGSTVHPCPAWALTEPVNITPRSTYPAQITPRSRRIPTPHPLSFVKSPITLREDFTTYLAATLDRYTD